MARRIILYISQTSTLRVSWAKVRLCPCLPWITGKRVRLPMPPQHSQLPSGLTLPSIFHAVIRCFLGDVDIVQVAFGHAGGGDAAEAGFGAEAFDVGGAAVAHAGAEAADHLIDKIAQVAAIGDAAFDAFGDELLGLSYAALAVS